MRALEFDGATPSTAPNIKTSKVVQFFPETLCVTTALTNAQRRIIILYFMHIFYAIENKISVLFSTEKGNLKIIHWRQQLTGESMDMAANFCFEFSFTRILHSRREREWGTD